MSFIVTMFLYDQNGAWVAFRTDYDGRYLFDRQGNWIGWFPWHDDDDAVSPDGRYLGTVVDDRLLRRIKHRYRVDPGYPGAPQFPGHVTYPGRARYAGPVDGFECVPAPLLQGRDQRVGSLHGV